MPLKWNFKFQRFSRNSRTCTSPVHHNRTQKSPQKNDKFQEWYRYSSLLEFFLYFKKETVNSNSLFSSCFSSSSLWSLSAAWFLGESFSSNASRSSLLSFLFFLKITPIYTITKSAIWWHTGSVLLQTIPSMLYPHWQSMSGRNWHKSVDAHFHPCLQERLLLIIWNCTFDPRSVYPKYRVLHCWSMPNSHVGKNRIKQSYEAKCDNH